MESKEWTIIISIIIVLIVLVCWASADDAKKWQMYSTEHHCVVNGYQEASVGTGVGPAIGGKGGVAVVTTYTPRKNIWQCDGGEIIIR